MDIANYQPRIIDKYLHVDNGDGLAPVNRRYVGRFGMTPKIIVIHIQEGTNWGSYQHFHSVLASATVFVGKNGDIWRLVPESDAPWTNGDVIWPSQRGTDIINKWGADPNVYSLTIETEGYTGEWPKTEAQLKSVLWQVYEWQKKYNIEDVYVIRHAEINGRDRAYCPGNAFYNWLVAELNKLDINPIQQPKFSAAQTVLVDGKPWDGKQDVVVNGAHFYSDPRKVTVVKQTPVNVYATSQSALTRGPVTVGEEFNVLGWVRGESINGEDRWWITKYFSRIHVSATEDKPEDGADDAPEVLPGGAVIWMGKVYYPARLGDAPRVLTVTNKANLRKESSLGSKIIGTVAKGDEITVDYWCFGDDVKGENVWYVLHDPKGSLQRGARVYATATSGRPD